MIPNIRAMCETTPELVLTAPYRQAQRLLADWLERDVVGALREVFAVRAAVAGLNGVEQHSLSRWLAWLCVAAASRGESILGRIRRLDSNLGASTEKALSYLPAGMDFQAVRNRRKSA
jgi:hypothetical protein